VPAEQRVREAMKLAEAVCKDGEIALEELSSGSRRGAVAEVRSLLARQLVTKSGIPQAKALKQAGSKLCLASPSNCTTISAIFAVRWDRDDV
jgi:hypothetical protein